MNISDNFWDKFSKILKHNFMGEKLKIERLNLNLSIKEVSEMINIAESTISKYEMGKVKNIDFETLKKLSNFYQKDYSYFYDGYESFPLMTSLVGMILCSIMVPNFNSLLIAGQSVFISSIFGFKYLISHLATTKKKKSVDIWYDDLTEEEREEFEAFKMMNFGFLRTKKLFQNKEIEEYEQMYLAIFIAHKIQRKNKIEDITVLNKEVKKDE